jgi:hypothetical protein
MPHVQTATLTIAEMREFASFSVAEQHFIEQGLDIALERGGAASRRRELAYRELRALRRAIPSCETFEGMDAFMGPLVRISASDLAHGRITSFAAYRFLYERLSGAAVRPFLPAAFCGAAALPQIEPEQRKILLQSLSEAAATAPAWSLREPGFLPEYMDQGAA